MCGIFGSERLKVTYCLFQVFYNHGLLGKEVKSLFVRNCVVGRDWAGDEDPHASMHAHRATLALSLSTKLTKGDKERDLDTGLKGNFWEWGR